MVTPLFLLVSLNRTNKRNHKLKLKIDFNLNE
jgi:hypothetical protein